MESQESHDGLGGASASRGPRWSSGAALSIMFASFAAQQLFILVFALLLAVIYGSEAFSEQLIDQPWINFLFVGVGSVGLLMVLGVYCFNNGIRPRDIGVLKLPLNKSWMIAVAYLVYVFALALLFSVSQVLFESFDVEQAQNVGFGDDTQGWQLILAFIGLVVIPPIAEELLFRGFLYNSLKKSWSSKAVIISGLVASLLAGYFLSTLAGFVVFAMTLLAVLISYRHKTNKALPSALVTSLFFALAHMQWNVSLDTFLLSLALIWVYEKTGSLLSAILLHAVKNAVGFTAIFLVTN